MQKSFRCVDCIYTTIIVCAEMLHKPWQHTCHCHCTSAKHGVVNKQALLSGNRSKKSNLAAGKDDNGLG